MRKVGLVSFDFTNNRIKMGSTWINGASLENETELRLPTKLLVPARSENIFNIKCADRLAFLPMDFEPRKIPGMHGLYE